MRLNSSDLESVIAVGQRALECETLDELHFETLKNAEHALGATSSVFFHVEKAPTGWKFTPGATHGAPESGMHAWLDHYKPFDPFVSRFVEKLGRGDDSDNVVVSNEVVSHRQFVSTEFYNDFLRSQKIYHVMVLGLVEKGRPVALLGLHRPDTAEPFSRRDIALARLLVRPLAGATRRARALEQLDESRAILRALADDLPHQGVVVLDADMTPVFQSADALALLGRLDDAAAVPEAITQQCQALLVQQGQTLGAAGAGHGAAERRFVLPLPGGVQRLGVRLRLLDHAATAPRYLVSFDEAVVAEGAPPVQSRQMLRFGLTRRETDIAHLVGVGQANKEIALTLGISVRTVQNHLRAIFEKVGVHNRASLIYRLSTRN
jgi:DNA-binding CsgD family transcriptional regulator/GAF domain-containing protein